MDTEVQSRWETGLFLRVLGVLSGGELILERAKPSAMTRISVLMCFFVAAAIGRTAPAETSAASLSELFAPGVVFQDRNADGAIDFVDARIVLPEQPTSDELAAAADVAARLGFETSAMDLPMVRPFDKLRAALSPVEGRLTTSAKAPAVEKADTTSGTGASIFIGAKSLAQAGVSLDAIGAAGLKAGDGLVTAFSLAGRPAVAVLGGDEAGLSAAAVMLAGHLPFIWDQKSATVDKIAARSRQVVDKAVVRPSARPLWFISTRGVCQEERSRDSINGTGPQERNRRSHQRRSERISRTGSTARSQSFEAAAGHGGRSLGSFLCLQRPLGAEHPGPCALRTVAA